MLKLVYKYVKGTFLIINMTKYTGLWGVPETSHWSQQAWASLLQVLPDRGKTILSIELANSVPLTGLLAILTPTNLPTICYVKVAGGTADLHTAEEWVDRLNEEGVLNSFDISETTIVVPPGVEADTMRATKRKFKRMSKLKWVTDMGEPYHFDCDEDSTSSSITDSLSSDETM